MRGQGSVLRLLHEALPSLWFWQAGEGNLRETRRGVLLYAMHTPRYFGTIDIVYPGFNLTHGLVQPH